jgi:putative DNA primase/helicase
VIRLVNPYAPVLARLDGLRQGPSGTTWTARCPAHCDRQPSLFLWVGKRDGALMARDLSGRCTWPQIVQALGGRYAEWFPDSDRDSRRPAVPELVATYDYRDEFGALRYQVLRYHPKCFRQRRPGGPGEWVWSTQGVERLPYRLPEVLSRPAHPVLITEGERDADNLAALGLLASCNAGGAGRWEPDLGRWFAGRRVAVLPDNDAPGLAHALAVVGSLVFWGSESVRLVSLPGLPPGGDVSDWLLTLPRRATPRDRRAALAQLVREATEWAPTTRTTPP